MSLTVVDIVAYIVAGLMAASKVLTAAKPLWNKLPKWLAVALPVVVMDIPQLLSLLGVATTGTSLTTAIVASVALILPGIAEAEASTAAPVAPSKSA